MVLPLQLTLVTFSYLAAFALLEDLNIGAIPYSAVLKTLPLLAVARISGLVVFRLYRGLWRYVGPKDLMLIIQSTTVSSLLFVVAVSAIFGLDEIPGSIYILDWAGNVAVLGGLRLGARMLHGRNQPGPRGDRVAKQLLIIGAGDAGAALCARMQSMRAFRFMPVAFVDDDLGKVGTTVHGVPVAGSSSELSEVVRRYKVDTAVIAIPSATSSQMRSLVKLCQEADVPFKVLPGISELLGDAVSTGQIRDVDPVDLLGRVPARLARGVTQEFIRGRRTLVTGGAGSVGSELARQIARFQPALLVLLDHSENSLFFLEAEIRGIFPDLHLVAQVVDITDKVAVSRVMAEYHPQVAFHAAAHKHVPLMERTPAEAVRNNVGGTYVVLKSAQEAGVETFVLVSTDKAVNPSSVMGATKRLAELTVQELNASGTTQALSVRFGNVLGSNASVVPIFKQQIADGGPVTVTHKDAQRYFMSISEAAGLILQAGAVGTGGEVFVLDMGDPIKIVTLAETMVSLVGLKPYEDIEIVFTGLRPGEKLSEELRFEGEDFQPTQYEKLLVLKDHGYDGGVVKRVEEFLHDLSGMDMSQVRSRLKDLVPEYQSSVPPTSPVQGH